MAGLQRQLGRAELSRHKRHSLSTRHQACPPLGLHAAPADARTVLAGLCRATWISTLS